MFPLGRKANFPVTFLGSLSLYKSAGRRAIFRRPVLLVTFLATSGHMRGNGHEFSILTFLNFLKRNARTRKNISVELILQICRNMGDAHFLFQSGLGREWTEKRAAITQGMPLLRLWKVRQAGAIAWLSNEITP